MTNLLKPVNPQPGKPLYIAARDHLRDAVDQGVFAPGEQMPSTKELSELMNVSLVTAHRALQELVNCGVLQRSQGKGTFVHQAYLEGRRTVGDCRMALVFPSEASLADFQYCQMLEGIRQAASMHNVDLVFLRFDEDVRKECNAFLYVNPLPDELESIAGRRKLPTLVLGARGQSAGLPSLSVDNIHLGRQATTHLVSQGHTRIAYIGNGEGISNSLDRWTGFLDGLSEKRLTPKPQWIIKNSSWRLSDREKADLQRQMSSSSRPTGVFAAGYYFALDVYAVAAAAGLQIGKDVSVIGVDDPPSAAFLAPPMTTLRQPLIQLGYDAIVSLVERTRNNGDAPVESRQMRAELIVRQSTSALLS